MNNVFAGKFKPNRKWPVLENLRLMAVFTMFYAYLISCLIWVWGKGAAYDLTTQSAFKICLWNADAVEKKTCF